MLSFTIACLAVFGMFGWIMYVSWGLTYFPLSLLKNKKVDRPLLQEDDDDVVRRTARVWSALL